MEEDFSPVIESWDSFDDMEREWLTKKLITEKMIKKQSILDATEGYKELISSPDEPEVTVICLDNSFMLTHFRGGGVHIPQAKAIALYARNKLDAHSCNEVGLVAMGVEKHKCWVPPTRDLKQIHSGLKGILYGGQAYIPMEHAFSFFMESKLLKRRLLVFFGGRLHSDDFADFQYYAKQLKKFNVAVDVVNIGLQFCPTTKHKLLKEFVEAANNDGNSRYLYAPSGSATSLGQQILSSPLAPKGLSDKEKMEYEAKINKKMEQDLLRAERKEAKKMKWMEPILLVAGHLIEEEVIKKMKELKNKEEEIQKMKELKKKKWMEQNPLLAAASVSRLPRCQKKGLKRETRKEQKAKKNEQLGEEEKKMLEKNKNKKMYEKNKRQRLKIIKMKL